MDFGYEAKFYNPETLGGITINQQKDRGKGLRACVAKFARQVTLHWELVEPERYGGVWDDAAKIRLAICLLGEFQHIRSPSKTERQCQEELISVRQALGWENYSKDVVHGNRDYAFDQ